MSRPGKKTRADVRPNGQIRQSQIVTTFGPGAMVDLPDHAVIIGGLDHWNGRINHRITEDRLAAKVKAALVATPDLKNLAMDVRSSDGEVTLIINPVALTARAIARAIYAARPAPGDLQPAWAARFGR